MKIQMGDVTIVIEPGDDPGQVVAMTKAIAGQRNTPPPVRAVAADPATSRKAHRCVGRGKCEGLYHASDAKNHRNFMCETYEHVASYKNGRSARQAADWASIEITAMTHRLRTLSQLGLLKRNGKVYVAASS